MPAPKYYNLPSMDQWKRDSNVTLAIRSREPGLERIDDLLWKISVAPGDDDVVGPLLVDLFLTIEYWFTIRKERPGRVHEGRLPAMRALFECVVDQLRPMMATRADPQPTAMSIGKTIAEMTSISMSHHGYVADAMFNMQAFDAEKLRTCRLEFDGGLAYRVAWWRPRPLQFKVLADSAPYAAKAARLANAGPHTPDAAPFIMDAKRRIYMTDHDRNAGIFHSSYTNGTPVAMAGTIVIQNGKVRTIRLDSGHYQPGVDNLPAFLMALRMHGVNLRKVRILDYAGNRVGGVDVSAETVMLRGANWKTFVDNATQEFQRQVATQEFVGSGGKIGWQNSHGQRGPKWDARVAALNPVAQVNVPNGPPRIVPVLPAQRAPVVINVTPANNGNPRPVAPLGHGLVAMYVQNSAVPSASSLRDVVITDAAPAPTYV